MSECEECGGTGRVICEDDDCGMELPCTECALAGRLGTVREAEAETYRLLHFITGGEFL